MPERTVTDLLREEYFDLLPDIRRAAEHIEAEVSYHLLPIRRQLAPFERVEIKMRIKECESALDSLRRRQDFASFDPELRDKYTLTELKNLAGIRVLAFPRSRLHQVNAALRDVKTFENWEADPVLGDQVETLALKYFGYCEGLPRVRGEYQIVSMLTGQFWEVEHSAIYKPSPRLRGAVRAPSMQKPLNNVYEALTAFEEEFERLIRDSAAS